MAKGVSNEEKLARARNWLIKSKSFFNKNELEKVQKTAKLKVLKISSRSCASK